MKLITDFHIHSHFSLATSSQLTPIYLDYWSRIKGLNIIATGDFTHPKWTNELQNCLLEAENGLFSLKKEFQLENIVNHSKPTRFILSAEISNIYKKNGKVRKVHNVVLAPSFESVIKIQKYLEKNNFNITSDGRPILGLDSEKLLEALLEIEPNIIIIPAHIWTPWFSALGSKSGFDSIEECYGSLSKYIYAVETGLSSDQPLNWLCSSLDKYCLLSNSDAHSPEKLGRNANLFDTEMSYFAIKKALENQHSNEFVGTIDMYPQEGKYHYDGHRKCNIVFNPTQTMQNNGLCPVCGSPLTLGVAHRIAELADRDNPLDRPIRKEFKYIIPLKEILAEIYQLKPQSQKINKIYFENIKKLGSELDILLNIDLNIIKKICGEFLYIAIDRLRNNNVIVKEGYDGEYGKINLFDDNELKSFNNNSYCFDSKSIKNERQLLNFDVSLFRQLKQTSKTIIEKNSKVQIKKTDEQNLAITTNSKHSIVISGPGTGKTYVLTQRIEYLINKLNIEPQSILTITFSNKAKNELKSRLLQILGNNISSKININTFHSLGLKLLQTFVNQNFILINENEKKQILTNIGVNKNQLNSIVQAISYFKNTLKPFDNLDFEKYFQKYENELNQSNCLDCDDLVYKTLNFLNNKKFNSLNFDYILIDEFQDINNAQYSFIKHICNANTSVFAIGDPNQSIYAFRGSDNSLVHKFQQEFDAQTFYLTKSYRCPNTILSAANNLIGNQQKIKGTQKGEKLSVIEQSTEKSEAEFIARTISNKIGGTNFFAIDTNIADGNEQKNISSLSDFAVLVRTKNLIEPITKALNDHKIPYSTADTNSVFLSEPFCFINSILKYTLNKQNKAFYDIFTEKTQGKFIYNHQNSLTQNIEKIWNLFFKHKYSELQIYFEKYLQLTKDKTIIDFLNEIEQLTGQDDIENEAESVKILTMHAAKGLEFECVFIPAFEQGIIPYSIFNQNTDIAEEQRLMYVALTRSKKLLYLSFCKSRKLNNLQHNFKPSIFLDMINKKNYELTSITKNKDEGKQMKLF